MYYGEIKKVDIANGPGTRVSLFVSGCRRHCKDCFNAETWDFSFGEPFTAQTEQEILRLLAPGGALSICCYPGHEEGARELAALRDWAAGLDIRQFNALEARFANQREDSPKLFLIQRAP